MFFIIPRGGGSFVIKTFNFSYIICMYRNLNYYFCIMFNRLEQAQLDGNIGVVKIKNNSDIKTSILRLLNKTTINVWCAKIYFRKKGSWINYRRKWPNFITMKFGCGHPCRVINTSVATKRYKRYVQFSNLLLLHLESHKLNELVKKLKKIQTFSIYTKRGLTVPRRIFIFKQGKVSQYSRFKSKIF